MSANVVNQIAFLRTSRKFPEDQKELIFEVNKAYIDTAQAVNDRTIGIYSINRPAITGNSYFFTSRKQQSFRQMYVFTSTANIKLGFKLSNIFQIIQMYGLYTSGTKTFGLIPATSVAIAGQISFYIDVDATDTKSDLIKFVLGAGAPALTRGTIIVEWIVNSVMDSTP